MITTIKATFCTLFALGSIMTALCASVFILAAIFPAPSPTVKVTHLAGMTFYRVEDEQHHVLVGAVSDPGMDSRIGFFVNEHDDGFSFTGPDRTNDQGGFFRRVGKWNAIYVYDEKSLGQPLAAYRPNNLTNTTPRPWRD